MREYYVLKLCIIGSDFRLAQQIGRLTADGVFSTDYSPTIGIDIVTKNIKVARQEIDFKIFIMSTHTHYNHLRSFYYDGSVGCIIIFNKGDRISFDAVSKWWKEFRNARTARIIRDPPIVILGVVTDLEEVTSKEGQLLADQLNCFYVESLSTDKIQIEALYTRIAKLILEMR